MAATMFAYKGRGLLGQKLKGEMVASDSEEVISRLQDAGLVVTSVSRAMDSHQMFLWLEEFVPAKERVFLLQCWAMYLESGMPMQTALLRLKMATHSRTVARALERVSVGLDKGMTLGEALRENRFLPPSWVKTLSMGEQKGDFAGTLRILLGHAQRSRQIKRQFVSMLLMPCILLGLVGIWFWVFLTRVVPTLVAFMQQIGISPPLARSMVYVSQIFYANTHWFVLAACLTFLVVRRFSRSDEEMGFFQKWVPQSMPLVGPLISKMQLIVIAAGLRTQLESGVPLPGAVRTMSEGIWNLAIRRELLCVADKLNAGDPVPEAFSDLSVLSDMARAMLAAGDKAGRLPSILQVVEKEAQEDLMAQAKELIVILRSIVVLGAGFLVGMLMITFFTMLLSGLGATFNSPTPPPSL